MDAKSGQVDALFACVTGVNAPGASVVVIHRGRVVHSKGYGLANLEHHIPNTPQTKLRLASVTKPFTAIAILQLQEAGLLRIDDPVAKHLPGLPDGKRITIRHLLTHTSGIRDSGNGPLEFGPGERMNYSNAGYRVLGRIIEKVSGLSYEQYLRKHVFEPLGMQDTGLDRQSAVLPNRASGYMVGERGGYVNAPSEDAAGAWAAGGLYSTAEDMARWDQALTAGKLIKRETVEEACAPVRLSDGSEASYGLGWAITHYRGLREVSHGGDITGFNTWIGRFPDQQFSVIVLSNIWMRPPGPLPAARDLARKIAGIYLADVMQPEERPTELRLAPEALRAYVGRYRLEGRQDILKVTGDILTIELVDGRLIGYDNAARAELCPESETVFYPVTDSSTKIRFIKDDRGAVTGATIHFMGVVEIRATRVVE